MFQRVSYVTTIARHITVIVGAILMQSSIAETSDMTAGYAVTKLSREEVLAQKGFGYANEKQKWAEDLSLEIMEAEPIQRVLKEIEERFQQDPAYQLPGAADIAADAAYTLVYRTVTYVVTEDPLRPMLLWSYNTGRQDDDKTVPSVSFIDSADSLYRMITFGKGYRYEITGRMADNPAAYITFEAWNAAQGLAPTVAYVTHVQSDTMTIAEDGTFSVFAGPEENPGYDNYLHLPEGGWIYVRESTTDWAAQRPIEDLQIKVLDNIEKPAPTFDELVARSIEVMHQSFDVYQTYLHKMFAEDDKNLYISFGNKPNSMRPQVATRGGAWGCVTGTLFNIPEDKALVVTIKTADADYFAIQLHDAWGRALIPIYLTNRNKLGSALNPDGSVTYVLAHTDPGVANWLDVRGNQSGSLIVRWQGLDVPADGSPAELVHGAHLVDLSELDNVLAEGTMRVTATQRDHELAIRKAAWELRGRD